MVTCVQSTVFKKDEAYRDNDESAGGCHILGDVPKHDTTRRDTHYLCKDLEGHWWRGSKADSSEDLVKLGNAPICDTPWQDTIYSGVDQCKSFLRRGVVQKIMTKVRGARQFGKFPKLQYSLAGHALFPW